MQDECRTSVPAAIADPLKRLPPSAVKASPLARYAVLDFRRGSEQPANAGNAPIVMTTPFCRGSWFYRKNLFSRLGQRMLSALVFLAKVNRSLLGQMVARPFLTQRPGIA